MLSRFDYIKVDRRGESKKAYMTTIDIIGSVFPGITYRFADDAKNNSPMLIQMNSDDTCDLPFYNTILSEEQSIPPTSEFTGEWINNNNNVNKTDCNILGEDGELIIDCASNLKYIDVPSVEASVYNLEYYGCKLIHFGEHLTFETDDEIPITIMKIGKDYVSDYLMKISGEYLEYHNRPHLHAPYDVNARGYLILGKSIGDLYHLTAYTIPYGCAIYTPPYVIHSDAHLIGKYMTVYSATPNYSTVILKNKRRELFELNINIEA